MDLHRLTHGIYEALKHWHIPVFVSFLTSITPKAKAKRQAKMSDLGDVPGDNILPNEILFSISSRRGP